MKKQAHGISQTKHLKRRIDMVYEFDNCWIEWEDPTYILSGITYSYPSRKRDMEECLKDVMRECLLYSAQNDELTAKVKSLENTVRELKKAN